MKKITERSDFPKYVQQYKKLKGICIGGCIDPDDSFGHEHAAHAHVGGKYKGWICFKYKYYFRKLVVLHEVAHIITGPQKIPHGKVWRKTLNKIGGTFKSFTYSFRRNNENWAFKNIDYTYRPNKI